jgi:GcrA cell cycle regulator
MTTEAVTETKWTPSRVQQLQGCVTAGLTCSQIAAEIGMTRNAVIGKLHRLGLSTGGRKPAALAKQMREGPLQARRQTRLVRLLRSVHAEMAAAQTPAGAAPMKATQASVIESASIESARRCSLLELDGDRCRWPLGDPTKPGFAFCGNDAVTGFSYCVGHARLAYRLPSGRRA